MGVLFDLRPSETRSVPQYAGYCYYVTGVSLVDPVSIAGQSVVNVIIEAEDEAFAIIGTLSPEAPVAAVQPELLVGGDLVLRHDAVDATVRFHGRVLDEDYCLGAAGGDVEEEVVPAVVEEDGEEEVAVVDYDHGEEGLDDEALEALLDDGEEGVTGDEEEEEEERQPKRRKIADE